jgi:Domain of unknown function (DUF4291)
VTPPYRQVRAVFTDQTITVYQAFPPEIAGPAAAAGRFVPPFKRQAVVPASGVPDGAAWAARLRASPVRVQWDPERSPRLGGLPYRSLQVGLSGAAVDSYVDRWTVGITDITPTVGAIRARLDGAAPDGGDEAAAATQLPAERPYPLPPDLAATIGADAPDGGTGA